MTELDAVLQVYETRPSTLDHEEVARRRAGLDLGWELNRLQGGVRSAAHMRLGELYATGRISKAEYADLAADLAVRDLLAEREAAIDAR